MTHDLHPPAGQPRLVLPTSAPTTATASATATVGPAARQDAQRTWLPLSPAQRMVWMDLRLGADPLAYQLAAHCRVDGALDLPLLQQALDLLAARHDALRLRVCGDQPRQWLAGAEAGPALPLVLHHLPDPGLDADHAAKPTTLDTWLQPLLAEVLPLGDTALARIDLVQVAPGQWHLLWRINHLLVDMASMTTMLQQWLLICNALHDETPGALPPGSSFVATLAAAEAYAASPAAQADLAHWQRRFAQVPAPVFDKPHGLALHAAQTKPADASHTGPLRFALAGQAYADWLLACSHAGVTEQRALVGLLAVAVGTRFGRRDLTLALALHGRDARTRPVIGMLASAMPVRCHWPADATLAQVVRQIAEQLDTDYRHQQSPVADISRALGLAARGQSKLFDISLSYVQAAEQVSQLALGAATLAVVPMRTQAIVPLPLLVVNRPQTQRLDFALDWDSAWLSAADAQSLADGLQRVLAQFCSQPGVLVAELPATSDTERCQLLALANPAPLLDPQDQPATRLLHQRVQAQARATPDAVAVVDGDLQWTYAQLDALSDTLAQRIHQALAAQQTPPGAEPVVAVALPRSAHTVLAVLAILKAGAVYLPLDTAYPLQRLQYLLDDGQAALLIDAAAEATAGLVAPRLGGDLADEAAEPDPALPTANTSHPDSADRLAYVIYTSGSTGQPKPVGVSHRAALNLALARQAGHDPVGPGDRVLAAISVGFDVSIGQLLLPLLQGAAIVIAPALRTLQAEAFWALLAQHSVTHINSVPSFFETVSEALLALPEARRYRGLKRLMLGGEPLTGALARKLQQRLPGTTIVNMYGPTEACIDATAYVVPAEGDLPHALPIGIPLANYRAYVLDNLGRLVPPGVAGELCLAGPGLARGYLRRPGATAEKFVADPYAGQAGERLYRTGDLARWVLDDSQHTGQIEFLGRNDQQVKIRGHRIETGEIEAALLLHAAVAQAAVIARKDAAGQGMLVGYLVARPGATLPDADTLKRWLLQRLPDPMVPAVLLPLAALPLTPNGKLNHRALPAPDADVDTRQAYEAPQGALETDMAALWSTLLQRPRIGRHDNFFNLGGHSLLVVQLASRVRSQYGLDLPLADLFARPTLAEFAATAAAVAASAAPTHALPNITAGQRSAVLPLSYAQQRLWFLAQLDTQASQAYHIAGGVRLRGVLQPAALQAALARIVQRHEALRTRFDSVAGGAVQRITQDSRFALTQHDLSDQPQPEQALQRVASAEAAAPFDLQQGPLIRARLLRLGTDHHALLVTMHHIVSDGWSMGVLINEFSTLYSAFSQGLPDPLPPLAVQYADYAIWQRRHLVGEVLQRQLDFWVGHLRGAPALLALPHDRPRPAVQSYQGAALAFALPAGLSAGLAKLSQRHGSTLYMTLLAAWALLLSRSSGQAQVVIGTPVANRTRAEAEPLIGFFVNTLALQIDLATAPSVADLLAQVRASSVAAQAHQDLPFEQLVEALKPARSLAHSPIFQVMFSWQNTPTGTLDLPGLTLQGLQPDVRSDGFVDTAAKFDLTLDVQAQADQISGSLTYATALFDRSTAARHLGHWLTLLQAMVDNDSLAVDRLPLLGTAERRQLLVDWNQHAPTAPDSAFVHEAFEQHAASNPEAAAVIDMQATLSYGALDAQANQLAHHLIRLGVQPDTCVALCLPRGAGMVVAVLAVLKAGGAYVPLDPDYPAQRLQHMLDQSAPVALLHEGALPPGLQAAAGTALVDITADAALWATQPSHSPGRAATGLAPQHLAYIIFTSGSTGAAKGVMVEHAGLAASNSARLQVYGRYQRFLLLSSFSFDSSVAGLFGALASGGTLCIPQASVALDPAALRAVIQDWRISSLLCVPSLLQVVLGSANASELASLQQVIVAGEACPPALLAQVAALMPQAALFNEYGPTENTVWATVARCPAAADGALVSIGRPVPHTQVYVLDAHRQPVPIGVAGELYIGGAAVARGYLHQPALTAERFVDNPFVTHPFVTHPFGTQQAGAGRLYRSGDLVRWRADGTLDFLGRNDHQVKIRGYRIELGEIEAKLLACPGVREAVVLARDDSGAGTGLRLVAYVTTHVTQAEATQAGTPLSVSALRTQLAASLPEHMVPAAYVHLAALPLTPNGKLDRKALPAPAGDAYLQRAYTPPQGDVETTIAAIWADLLQQAQVGRDDDFFDLGGHSLLAISVMERMRQAGLQTDVATLFAQPTLRGLAAACASAGAPDHISVPPPAIPPQASHITPAMLPMVALTQAQIDSVVAQVPGGAAQVQDIYPLAPLQQGMLYHHLVQTEGDVYITPMVTGFASQAALQAFVDALGQVVQRHDILRTSIAWDGLPEPVQVVWRSAPLALEWLEPSTNSAPTSADTANPAADALETLKAAIDTRIHRLDLRRAPLLRAVALHDPLQQRWLLALCLHHLALDHTSMAVVLQEVRAIGQGLPLAAPVPFRGLVWRALHGVSTQAHEAFFSNMLGTVRSPTVPYGVQHLAGQAQRVRDARQALPPALASAVRAQARAAGVTAASLLHLAWGLVLSRVSMAADDGAQNTTHNTTDSATTRPHEVVFGTVLFGRMGAGPGADRALGMLINTLPLRLALGNTPVAEALASTHLLLLALMRHEHAPLALAQRCSGVAAPTPLFTALFNLRHNTAANTAQDAANNAPTLLWGEERTGYPLALAVDDDGQGFTLHVQAVQPIHPHQVAALMQQAVQSIVGALQAAPHTTCDALDVLGSNGRSQLLALANPVPLADPQDQPGTRLLHQRVQAQARSTPDAVAVVDGDLQWTYAQLDALSDRLALRIHRALAAQQPPPGPEPVVAVALPRSAHTVLALLAILKAGAVYLPLDTAYPLQRLQYLLDDGQAALLIDAAAAATTTLVAPRLRVDDLVGDLVGHPLPGLPVDNTCQPEAADRLAYVIYTSGSTGQPKPVGISHRAALNLALARQAGHDPIGVGSRVLAAISVGFDVSIGQLLLPLLQGATIVIAPALRTLEADAFWALLARHRVTHINSVPSFFEAVSEALLAMPEAQRYRGLQRLMLGGEPLTGALARKLQMRLPGTQIVNMYGPTEACIDATAYVVPAQGDLPHALPIGVPLANYRAYVLDSLGRLVPPGVTGELCLAGPGLARGYLRRPAATAEKFVADPFATTSASTPGERLYRTGDLARWVLDDAGHTGQIEFLGRNDQQVKVRGHRIETGEIEAALLGLPGVQQAAVIARPDSSGQNRLLAYLVGPASATDPTGSTLQQQLALQLPSHMVPSALQWLGHLPLTANGKLDQRALPALDANSPMATTHVAPRNALEQQLQAVWQQVLGQPRIGMDDDFFALGGHSLLALQLVTACQAAIRQSSQPGLAALADTLSLRGLLAQPSIAGMAAALGGTGPATAATRPALPHPLVALRASGSRRPLFCVHPQSGTTWCYADLVRHLPPDVPVYGLHALGLMADEQALHTVPAMAAACLQALRQVQPQGPYQLMGYSSGGVAAYEMALQLRAAGQVVSLLVLLDSPLPDGSDVRPHTDADVLDDAGRVLGVADAAQMPRHAADLLALLQARGLAEPGMDTAAAQRLIHTARSIVQATRRYNTPASGQALLQVRALQRDSALPDWAGRVPAASLHTHDLDTDHTDLLGPRWAPEVARLVAPGLG